MIEIPQGQTPKLSSSVDIRELLYDLRSWAWLILLIGALTGLMAYFISGLFVPIYQSSTYLLVSASPPISSVQTPLIDSSAIISTYAEMLVDQSVLLTVIDRLKLKTTPDQLKKSITISSVRNTQLLSVSVEDPSPQRAATIANMLGQVFSEYIRDLQTQRYAQTKNALNQQIIDLQQQIESITSSINNESNPDKKKLLQASLAPDQELYSNLSTSLEQIRLAESQINSTLTISQQAFPSSTPIRPQKEFNALFGALTAMMITTGTIYLLNNFDETIRNPEEITTNYGLLILGIIANHEIANEKPISLDQPRSPVAESFRSIRAKIIHNGTHSKIQRILVTSPTPEDGKTTVTSNLAVAFAESNRKTVLVDFDLRRPQIHNKFGLPNRIGISQLLSDNSEISPNVFHGDITPDLTIITSGSLPGNPSELLESPRRNELITQLSENFDIVLIDTPPVLVISDAIALAQAVDGVILVVKPGKTRKSDLKQTIEQLRSVDAHLLGVILNEVNIGSRKYGYYFGGYYSKYSYYYDQSGVKLSKRKKAPSNSKNMSRD